MKNNRRWIAALLLAGLTLAGCGSADDISGQIVPAETTAPAAEFSGEITPAETTAPAETQAVLEETPVSLGRMEGGTYTNNYAGFGFVLDSSWQFYTAEELQTLPENVETMFDGTELGDAAAGMEQITDMMAENVNDMTTLNINYTKMGMQERLVYAMMTEEQIADSVLAESEMLLAAYSQAGIEVFSMEKVQVTFLGEPHFAIKTVAAIQDIDYYILQLFDYRAGQYGITTTLASFVEDKTDSLLELFYAVD